MVGAQAQTAAPANPAPDKAAMERAQREADGPKRRILEAARLKVAVRTPDAPAVATPAAPRPRPEAAEPEVPLATLPAAASPLPLAPVLPAPAPTVAPVQAVPLSTAAVSLVALPAPQAAASNLPPPVLLNMVEPEWPARLFRRGAQRTEVVVELTLRVDGSVADAAVRRSPNPELDSAVLEAVRQWRYEPQPVTRQHLVRLVVSPG